MCLSLNGWWSNDTCGREYLLYCTCLHYSHHWLCLSPPLSLSLPSPHNVHQIRFTSGLAITLCLSLSVTHCLSNIFYPSHSLKVFKLNSPFISSLNACLCREPKPIRKIVALTASIHSPICHLLPPIFNFHTIFWRHSPSMYSSPSSPHCAPCYHLFIFTAVLSFILCVGLKQFGIQM